MSNGLAWLFLLLGSFALFTIGFGIAVQGYPWFGVGIIALSIGVAGMGCDRLDRLGWPP